MKTHARGLFGLLGVGALALASLAPFAAIAPAQADALQCTRNGATLTITDSTGANARTLKAYKIANITATDTKPVYQVSPVETIDAAVKTAFQTGTTASDTVKVKATGAESVASLEKDVWNGEGGRASQIRRVANALENAKANLGTPVDLQLGTANVVDAGIYLVVDETTVSSQAFSRSAPMIVPTTYARTGTDGSSGACVYEGSATLKATKSAIEKEVTEDTEASAFVGDAVSFTLNVTAPIKGAFPADQFRFYVEDTLPAGLEYKTGSATVAGVKAEPSVSGQKIMWNFSDKSLTSVDDPTLSDSGAVPVTSVQGTSFQITYEATVKDTGFVTGSAGNTNSAKLAYSNDARNLGALYSGAAPATAKVYQGEITINKTDTNGGALEGATFQVQCISNCTNGVDGNTNAYDKTVNTGSTLAFPGLLATENGTVYTVTETAAPSNYAKVSPFTVTVKVNPTTSAFEYTVQQMDGVTLTSSTGGKATITVANKTLFENLASTGGNVALILAAAVVLLVVGVVAGRARRKVQK